MRSQRKAGRCVIILSDKSSGSSALQYTLARHDDVRLVSWTPHRHFETMYWMKAAAILGLEQPQMITSNYLPVSGDRARADLMELLSQNVPEFEPATRNDHEFVMKGWEAMVRQHAPVFIEKSPHHLHSSAALGLIQQAAKNTASTQHVFIGLVRNPTDTLYSMWQRWRIPPARGEEEWIRAYQNLLRFQEDLGDTFLLVRYEDIVSDGSTLDAIWRHVGLEPPDSHDLHAASLSKWRQDSSFGYRPSQELTSLAAHFGYAVSDLTPSGSRPMWKAVRAAEAAKRWLRSSAGRFKQTG